MIKEAFETILKICSIIFFIVFIGWIGIKGFIGVIVGFSLMAYLIISGNPLLLSFLEKFNKKEKVEYIKRKWL